MLRPERPSDRSHFSATVAFELEAIVPECFAVQAGHKIIGVAVRCIGGFRVFSSNDAYRKLENRIFPNARAVARSVLRLGARA
jgi:hypothetical protein